MLNFYNRFLKDIASIQAPLLKLISGRKRNNNAKIEWTSELKQSFRRVKEHLSQATSLAFPDSNATLSLQTDASDKAIGATTDIATAQQRISPTTQLLFKETHAYTN